MSFSSIFAQKDEKYERIKALKIGYITEKVTLTPNEAKKFWPIYEKYSQELDNLHSQSRKCKKNGCENIDMLTEKEALEILKKDAELSDKIHRINKEKDTQLLSVLSAKKLLLLKNAEKEFYKKLMKQYKKEK